jgi:hypothetical protein
MYEYYYTTQTRANTRNHTQKKKDPTLMKNQLKEDKTGKVASQNRGVCKKKRKKVENSTLPAFAKSKVGSSCGTTGLEATTV